MLQPRQSTPEDQLKIARILWAALTGSALMYGLVLFTTGKVSHVTLPENDLLPIEMVSLSMNFLAVFVFWFYKNNVATLQDMSKRLTGYIVCWALSESIALIGFAAVFISDKGNGFFYAVNLLITFALNILTFPKKEG